jgi:UDP-N-acetyl-D-mannosaminuronate dehydrogenase
MSKNDVIVVGLGEVGKPLFELVSEKHPSIGIDIAPVETPGECAVLHICYPFGDSFVKTASRYIEDNNPALTIINSTVSPGTTRAIHKLVRRPIVYSPIRGKHFKMKQDLLHYTKFIGGIDPNSAAQAARHFESLGMKTKIVQSPEAAELAKLAETTYFGLLIGWAQELERFCSTFNANYDEVAAFFGEVGFLPPVKYTPGVIGGHCVMPNINILLKTFRSDFLDAIVRSNELKVMQTESVTSAVEGA